MCCDVAALKWGRMLAVSRQQRRYHCLRGSNSSLKPDSVAGTLPFRIAVEIIDNGSEITVSPLYPSVCAEGFCGGSEGVCFSSRLF
jgi:hypothetical protein